MEFLKLESFKPSSNSGITSIPLLASYDSTRSGVEIVRVLVEPGAMLPPHALPMAEEVWIGVSGVGLLLLAERETRCFAVNEIVRFAGGDLHGFQNTGSGPFIYLSVMFSG